MADVTITPVALGDDGVDLTSGLQALAAADTYYYDNSTGTNLIYLISTATVTVTIETTFTGAGKSLPDHTESMSNGDALLLQARTRKFYKQSDQTVKITVSDAGVSAGVYIP